GQSGRVRRPERRLGRGRVMAQTLPSGSDIPADRQNPHSYPLPPLPPETPSVLARDPARDPAPAARASGPARQTARMTATAASRDHPQYASTAATMTAAGAAATRAGPCRTRTAEVMQ